MWQRIQTVFLVFIIITLLVTLIQPVWSIGEAPNKHVLTPFYFLSGGQYMYIPNSLTAIFAIASITVAFMEIRKYKNRMLQMKLGALNSFLMVGTIGSSIYFASQLAERFQGGYYGLGFFLPGLAVIFNLLANFFIRKDEKLVRSSERLR